MFPLFEDTGFFLPISGTKRDNTVLSRVATTLDNVAMKPGWLQAI